MSIQPDWLKHDYATAMKLAVERAMEKRADLAAIGQTAGAGLQDLGGETGSLISNLLSNPHIRRALAGALIGGGIGGIADPGYDAQGQHQSRVGNVLRGGLLGGVVGGGSGILKNYLEQYPPNIAAMGHKLKDFATATGETALTGAERLQDSIKSADISDTINKAEGARRELGILGVNEKQLDPVMSQLRKGTTSVSSAIGKAKDAVPGAMEQLRNVPGAVSVAMRQGDFGNAAAQLDVPGFKNLSPWAQNFSLPTAAASIGAGVLGHRALLNNQMHDAAKGLFGLKPGDVPTAMSGYLRPTGSQLSQWFKEHFTTPKGLHTHPISGATRPMAEVTREMLNSAPSRLGRMTRFGVPVALATIPLAMREWLGHGYRSGNQPIQQLAEAQQQLGGR